MASNPVIEYRTILSDSGNPGYVNRILIGTACTGLVRIEWVQSRYGQMVPVNWSQVDYLSTYSGFYTLRYPVDDAQNIIVKTAIEKEFEWLLLWEHDVLAPPNAYMVLNDYMRSQKYPIVSGLYFTRSRPADPLVFKGRGNGAYLDWKFGDLVWCDGLPTGFLLVHTSILKAMWPDCEEYEPRQGVVTRKVFWTPREQWVDPANGWQNSISGTSDLDWCTRVIGGDYIRKAGWNKFMDELQDPKCPLLVDTNLFCRHINPNGEIFP